MRLFDLGGKRTNTLEALITLIDFDALSFLVALQLTIPPQTARCNHSRLYGGLTSHLFLDAISPFYPSMLPGYLWCSRLVPAPL